MILRITYFTAFAAILSTVVLFVLTHIPGNFLPQNIRFYDKQLHYIAYSIVSLLYGLAFSPRGIRGLLALLAVVVMMCVLAAIDEYTQQYFGRTTDIKDYYADLRGIATGVGVAFFVWMIKTLRYLNIKVNISR